MAKSLRCLLFTLLLSSLLLSGCQGKPRRLPEPLPPEPPHPLIVIDAGHQAQENPGKEPLYPGADEYKAKVSAGTSGVVTKIPEHEINLRAALALEKELQRAGFRVQMVRRQAYVNISNKERAELASNANADLFIRLHCDYSSNAKLSGVGIFYPAKNRELRPGTFDTSLKAAKVMAETFTAAGFTVHEPQAREDLTGFNWSWVPTILVEMGYMSNPTEDQSLADTKYTDKLARIICKAIDKQFKRDQ